MPAGLRFKSQLRVYYYTMADFGNIIYIFQNLGKIDLETRRILFGPMKFLLVLCFLNYFLK